MARVFDLQANPTTGNIVIIGGTDADVAARTDGSFVVVAGASDAYNVRGRLVGASGVPITDAFTVSTPMAYKQWYPHVATDASGGFAVTWQASGVAGGDGTEVLACRYNSSAVPLAAPVQVNTTILKDQDFSQIAMNSSGQSVIGWYYHSDFARVMARLYDSSLRPTSVEIRLDQDDSRWAVNLSLAMKATGHYVAVWEDQNPNTGSSRVLARAFGPDGQPTGAPFEVSDSTSRYNSSPDVALWDTSEFVVTWKGPDADRSGIYARLFDANALPLSDQFSVNRLSAGNQLSLHVATGPHGEMVFVWQQDYSPAPGYGAYGAIFIPEPGTLTLLALGGLAILRHRRTRRARAQCSPRHVV
ncbi:MAG: PEP-CTERM sorting domain-containing protein [Planctomycetes bacterium]|nr:PEP-CTERM sorting domain-containing protein [Planctomycetota bacterium]